MTKFHENVLTQKEINQFTVVASLFEDEFYLAGGTALALQIGHRISLDFDLFSQQNKLLSNFRESTITSLSNAGLSIKISENGTLSFLLNGVAFSLFYYPYDLTSKFSGNWHNINLAGIIDIACMKLSAIQGRGSKKDFIDLFFIAREYSLVDLLQNAEKKFKSQDNFTIQACKALTYFDDAEKEPMPKMLKKISWTEIKLFFLREAKRAIKFL